MDDTVLEKMIKSYMATDQPTYSICWQGGEPCLMGLDFFSKAVGFQKKYGKPGAVVANGLQTNATLITDGLAELFSKFQFLLGCSLDGPPEIHDHYRKTKAGNPSHNKVLDGINRLKHHDVEFNILTLVSKANVHKAQEVFQYLIHQGFYYHQYIPCVEFDTNGNLLDFAIKGYGWGDFMCEIFDNWYPAYTSHVSIRHFDSILYKMVEGSANICNMSQNCCQYFVVENNGDIYPCDFFVEKPLKIGNVLNTSWEEAFNSKIYREFGAKKAQWNKGCDTCDCLDLCMGDCLKHRLYKGDSPENRSLLCAGWKQFIQHTRKRFQSLAKEIVNRRHMEQQQTYADEKAAGSVKVGRNAPCPCGSGKKFKKCCGV